MRGGGGVSQRGTDRQIGTLVATTPHPSWLTVAALGREQVSGSQHVVVVRSCIRHGAASRRVSVDMR